MHCLIYMMFVLCFHNLSKLPLLSQLFVGRERGGDSVPNGLLPNPDSKCRFLSNIASCVMLFFFSEFGDPSIIGSCQFMFGGTILQIKLGRGDWCQKLVYILRIFQPYF